MTSPLAKNEPDGLFPVLCLQVGSRNIDMRDYDGFCSIGHHEPTSTYYWTWDNWASQHGPFPTATKAFLSWERCWNKTASVRVGWPPKASELAPVPAPVPTLDPTRWTNRGTNLPATMGEDAPVENLAAAKQECKIALGRVIARQTYPGSKVSHIAGSTYRVNIYEPTTGIIPIQRLVDTFLVDVNDTTVIRRPAEVSHKLVKYSDKWARKS